MTTIQPAAVAPSKEQRDALRAEVAALKGQHGASSLYLIAMREIPRLLDALDDSEAALAAARTCLAGALASIASSGPEVTSGEAKVVIVVPDAWREQALAAMGTPALTPSGREERE